MNSKSSKPSSLYKNLMCLFFGLVIIFVTSIFIFENYYSSKIQKLIDETTLLTDYHFIDWGQFNSLRNGTFSNKLSLYNITNHTSNGFDVQKVGPFDFDYSYQYKNLSFTQGNEGKINYINTWQRKLIDSNQIKNLSINTLNLGVERVFEYQYHATQSRKFTMMFNHLKKIMVNVIQKFYAFYMFEIYFKDQDLVQTTIFDVMQLDKNTSQALYNDQKYGFANPENMIKWSQLAFSQTKELNPLYEQLQKHFNISPQQIEELVGSNSMINQLASAINSTIKSKIISNPFSYEQCQQFCSTDQLIAFQISNSFLTNTALFPNINLQKLSNDIDSSLLSPIEYKQFCTNNDDIECMPQSQMISLFINDRFSSFSWMSKGFGDKSNLEIIAYVFNLDQLFVQSVMPYVDYLQNNVFDVGINSSNFSSAYQFMFPNYNYLPSILGSFQEILNIQLHSRAFFNKYILQDKTTCKQYFQNSYQNLSNICSKVDFNLSNLQSVKKYMKAYFFIDRQNFINKTAMSLTQASNFLFLDENSLFAQQMSTLRKTIATQYGCKTVCSFQELSSQQWGSNSVLKNLPSTYFSKKEASILDWDENNVFNKVEPQFSKLMNESLSQKESYSALYGVDSMTNIYNMMRIMKDAINGDLKMKKLLVYIQKIVINLQFKSPFTTYQASDLIYGKQSSQIVSKQKLDTLKGGAPWLNNKTSLINTEYKSQYFSKIDSGIYQKQRLRKISSYEGSSYVSSRYQVFQSKQDNIQQIIESQNRICGTNLFGFKQQISLNQVLTTFIDFAHKSVRFHQIETIFNEELGTEIYKYAIQAAGSKYSIGVAEQNEHFLAFNPNSHILVEPFSGKTLEVNIDYTIYARPSYLTFYSLNSSIDEFPLYTMDVTFKENNLKNIIELKDTKHTLFVLEITTLCLSGVAIVFEIILAVLYCRKRKYNSGLHKIKQDFQSDEINDYQPMEQ